MQQVVFHKNPGVPRGLQIFPTERSIEEPVWQVKIFIQKKKIMYF